MKKIITILAILVIASSFVMAASNNNSGIHEPGTGIDNPEIKEARELGQGNIEAVPTLINAEDLEIMPIMAKERKSERVKEKIQEKRMELDKELNKSEEPKREVLKKQNQVRLAVHSLLAMENYTGGIGPQVREVARNFNNSVEKTIKSEEKIQKKSKFARFFTGGDKESAEEIEKEVNSNRQKIQQLKQLRQDCQCDDDVRLLMEEQIQTMDQEQTRLQKLSENEKKSKGLIGWLWK